MNFCTVALTPALAAVAAALHAESGLPERWTEAAFLELLGMAGAAGLLLLAADEPVGLVLWRTVADEAEILTICVRPDYRTLGGGRCLLAGAIGSMEEHGVRRLTLEVAENNQAATALYLASGFRPVGRRPGYYRIADGPADALILAKDL